MMTDRDLARHQRYMRVCIGLARRALETHDTPVGSIVVLDDEIVGEGVEAVRAWSDVTAHAEIVAVRRASSRLGSVDLIGCTVYTTVEPCVMCAYALRLARIAMVVAGARSSQVERSVDGCRILSAPDILPDRTPPVLVRDVLAGECAAVLAHRSQ